MKNKLTLAMLLTGLAAFSQVKVGDNPTTVNTSSLLELESADKGLLLPRVALTSTAVAAPLGAHVLGMHVYNTVYSGMSPNNVTPGEYYNDGTKWVRLLASGEADATPDAFVNNSTSTRVELGKASDGTTNRTAGTYFVIKDTGSVGIGTNTPFTSTKLHVTGSTLLLADSNPLGSVLSNSSHDIAASTDLAEKSILRIVNASAAAAGNKAMIGFNSFNGTGATWSVGSQQNNASAANSNFHIFYSDGVAAYTRPFTIRPTGYVGINNGFPASTLDVTGSIATAINTISSATTLDATHSYIVANAGTYLITLPTASGCRGRIYTVKVVGTGTKTISSYMNLSGTAITSLTNNASITLVSDGTNWQQF